MEGRGNTSHRILDYERYFNRSAKRRRGNKLVDQLRKYGNIEVFMAGGLPNAAGFPIEEGQLTLNDERIVLIPQSEMERGLQYGSSSLPPLKEWLTEHQQLLHSPPTLNKELIHNSDMDLLVCNGSQDALHQVVTTVLEEGEYVITEEYTYSSFLELIASYGSKALPIKSDSSGMIPSDLDQKLSSWDVSANGRRPRLLYCVPIGGNPTGNSWTLERKKQIYSLARKYDLLILEDDAYYMLHYTRPIPPSLLSLDVDGRVLRCDSFSKILAPGFRLGYISGPRQFLEKIIQAMQVAAGSGNTLGQTLVYKVLQTMGHDGYIEHGDKLSKYYKDRCDTVLKLAHRHLQGLAEWSPPAGGMFLWLKLLGVQDSDDVVQKVIKRGALFVQGHVFSAGETISPYIRMSFSYVTEEQTEKAFIWLAEVLIDDRGKK